MLARIEHHMILDILLERQGMCMAAELVIESRITDVGGHDFLCRSTGGQLSKASSEQLTEGYQLAIVAGNDTYTK